MMLLRVSTLIWILLVTLSGYTMFQVKNRVARLDDRLQHVNRQIAQDQEQIHSLNAEWAVLTQPRRLEELSQRFLSLAPVGTAMLGALDQPPLRPPADDTQPLLDAGFDPALIAQLPGRGAQ
jgi:hypothetical protein